MPEPIPFTPHWPEADRRFLHPELPTPPALPLADVLAALLAVTDATMGNARWVSPWRGWAEPPVIWSMCIGKPRNRPGVLCENTALKLVKGFDPSITGHGFRSSFKDWARAQRRYEHNAIEFALAHPPRARAARG